MFLSCFFSVSPRVGNDLKVWSHMIYCHLRPNGRRQDVGMPNMETKVVEVWLSTWKSEGKYVEHIMDLFWFLFLLTLLLNYYLHSFTLIALWQHARINTRIHANLGFLTSACNYLFLLPLRVLQMVPLLWPLTFVVHKEVVGNEKQRPVRPSDELRRVKSQHERVDEVLWEES